MISYYYLHTNGALIHKRFLPDPSDFVRCIWTVDPADRKTAWILLIEALVLGASITRVKELAGKWGCTLRDCFEFMMRNPEPSAEQRKGLRAFLKDVCSVVPDAWFDWLEQTPKGGTPDWETMPVAQESAPTP